MKHIWVSYLFYVIFFFATQTLKKNLIFYSLSMPVYRSFSTPNPMDGSSINKHVSVAAPSLSFALGLACCPQNLVLEFGVNTLYIYLNTWVYVSMVSQGPTNKASAPHQAVALSCLFFLTLRDFHFYLSFQLGSVVNYQNYPKYLYI